MSGPMQAMEHTIKMWSAVCSMAPYSHCGKEVRPHSAWQMESPNTSLQTIELNSNCSKQAHSNRLGTGHGYERTKPRCILTVLRVLQYL